MIHSMTGFAVATTELENGSLTLELRSVNHRYLDLQFRMPDELRMHEPALREAVAANMSRGKIECRINFVQRHSAQHPAQLNMDLLRQLQQWSAQIREILPSAPEPSVIEILRWNGILESASVSSETMQSVMQSLMLRALQEFSSARAREGEKLTAFLLDRVSQIETLRLAVIPRMPETVSTYENKLRSRLLEALGNADDERVRQEMTLYASKIDVDEELSRLQTHLLEVRRVLDKGGAVGKRLDFLMQELHREANTLGSKSVDSEVSRTAMEIKLLIEQMREQVQNIE